jgi:predicted DCC family thiol-disulfide oxidoreductase YuxK
VIIVFDAKCLLCDRSVRFLLRHDKRQVFKFASIQGKAGQALLARAGLRADGLETMLLAEGAQLWRHSGAILRILGALGWPWKLAWIAWLVPAPLRDTLYRAIARRRYRLFGKSDLCLLPSPAHAGRFLD